MRGCTGEMPEAATGECAGASSCLVVPRLTGAVGADERGDGRAETGVIVHAAPPRASSDELDGRFGALVVLA